MIATEARAGHLGAVADELDQIDARLQSLDEEADRQVRQVKAAAAPEIAETLATTVRRQYIDLGVQLRRSKEAALERRRDLRDERRNLRNQVDACHAYLTEHAADEQRLLQALAYLDEAFKLLDPSKEYQAHDAFRDVRGAIRLPGQMEQTRANLRASERRLVELGEE